MEKKDILRELPHRMIFTKGDLAYDFVQRDGGDMRYRMFTEIIFATGVIHHHFLSEKGNEDQLLQLEKILSAYDRFELDSRKHTRKFTLSKTPMMESNVTMSAPDDGTTWKMLEGMISLLPDPSDSVTSLSFCHRLYDCGIEKLILRSSSERNPWAQEL